MTAPQPIFAGREFTLTTDSVAEIRDQAARNLVEVETILSTPDEDPRLIRNAQSGEVKTRETAALFDAHDDEVILGIVKNVFDRGRELEVAGTPVEDLVDTVYGEVPEANLLYGLLRLNPWGYKLGQTRMAIQAERRTKQ